ncbi:MAG: UDP-N-acetylglucosamine--N-acetylmuramyl-(pentapeptide) pyrophosphoryl-undecaprenolN-acetylglucosamine transferase [Candidatus Tokpelaia hoelldobleri]|uniref:UDP-N-acetylglucosamine--N-acetylmuramyl-(pentapeptide) pyrophosphoryl-undecaprenol N-acetylglucosamine transferase n=1 Tax=Candidatus Tokpelaia hoelldobleri TaxID=1902579 RepID=A0A1U9JVU9_9HYPH|nr:MAG: UDP-N-acetylglucosamine--N-acetylmuramyl-(pentapeptide) pyrophosphoryl-undecaprenolN-acetylglucosamine transferase [Candidatus Tokpelaia hoelldoblerii]
MKEKGTIVLAAGGTGGHLFPAEALGLALLERGFDVHLITDRRAEQFIECFPQDHVHVISAGTLSGKNPFTLVRGAVQLTYGLWQARRLLRRLRPDLVAGFGGYPTLPPLLGAVQMGIPTFIHEQNAVMGRANRFLAKRVTAIAGGFLQPEGAFAGKIIVTGNPLRAAVIGAGKVRYRPSKGNAPFSLLVFGGSQGAHFFSEIMPQALTFLDEDRLSRLVITQQAREEDATTLRFAYDRLGVKAEIAPFFTDMAEHIAHAHFIIARSGASTVSEIAAIGRPALLVPYPHALDHDQALNAKGMAEAGGAGLIEQRELTPDRLAKILVFALEDPDKLADIARKAHAARKLQATRKLVMVAEGLVAGRSIERIKKGVNS